MRRYRVIMTAMGSMVVAAALLLAPIACDRETPARDRKGKRGQPGGAGNPQPARLAPPDGNDVVVFIAKYKPQLFRLVGTRVQPFGNAQFYSPVSLIADPQQKCFFVLDRPKFIQEAYRIWQIRPDGSARVVLEIKGSAGGGPLGNPLTIGLDGDGGLVLADSVAGLFAIRNNQLSLMFDGHNGPVKKITAASGDARGQLYVGSSYMHEVTGGGIISMYANRLTTWIPAPGSQMPDELIGVTGVGNSTGRQSPIREWKNQGGLYRVDLKQNTTQMLGVNREQGGAEYDTLWRQLRQIYVDVAGGVWLIDEGSKKKFRVSSYNTSTSIINGGILLLHPDGQLEDMTYKTPDQSSGPLRRPRGITQWDQDSYLVADPELYVPQVEGSGGLMMLGRDGSRQVHAALGYKLKPCGVAILRR